MKRDWDDMGEDDDEKYWFTKDKINKIDKVHKYLETSSCSWKSFIFFINCRSSYSIK